MLMLNYCFRAFTRLADYSFAAYMSQNNNSIASITSFDGFPRLSPAQFNERFPGACVGERRDPRPGRCATSVEWGAYGVDSDSVRVLLLSGNVRLESSLLESAADDSWTHIAVDGDLHLDGCGDDVIYARGIRRVYHVGGDLHCGAVDLTAIPSNAVAGRIVADSAWLGADDDCAMRTAPELRLHARYLFVWFYSIDDLAIAPETVIFILGSDYYCEQLRLPNPVFQWHEDIHVLGEPYVAIVQDAGSDANGWLNVPIERALAMGRSILRDGVDLACYPYHRAAEAKHAAEDYRGAYLLHKKSATISPGFYEAWFGMGRALFAVGAYRQALAAHTRAGALFPQDQKGLVNMAYNHASLCALYLGRLEESIAFASLSIAHNSDAGFEHDNSDHACAYRCRAEAYLLSGRADNAFADLEKCLQLDRYDEAAHWLMGLVHYRRGDMERARACHALAVKYDDNYAAFYDTECSTAHLYCDPADTVWDEVTPGTVLLQPAPDA